MTDIAKSSVPIQQESVQFNNPVSESSAGAMGAAINYLLGIALPVGSIVDSMLNETQFQAQLNDQSPVTWILADGRDVTGSNFQIVTGFTNVPDLRGIMRRGLNNGGSSAGTRNDGNQNPNDPTGVFPPGTYANDTISPNHTHSVFGENNSLMVAAGGNYGFGQGNSPNAAGANVGLDTAPKNVSVNSFIRIN